MPGKPQNPPSKPTRQKQLAEALRDLTRSGLQAEAKQFRQNFEAGTVFGPAEAPPDKWSYHDHPVYERGEISAERSDHETPH